MRRGYAADCQTARAVGLLLLTLRRDGFHRRLHLFRIAQVIPVERLHLVVEFINKRHAGRYVQFNDVALGDFVEILHQRADTVAMRRDQHSLAFLNRRSDSFVPQRQEARHRIL